MGITSYERSAGVEVKFGEALAAPEERTVRKHKGLKKKKSH